MPHVNVNIPFFHVCSTGLSQDTDGFYCLYVVLLLQVFVLYFAKSAELAGVKEEEIVVPISISSQDLWRRLVEQHPR